MPAGLLCESSRQIPEICRAKSSVEPLKSHRMVTFALVHTWETVPAQSISKAKFIYYMRCCCILSISHCMMSWTLPSLGCTIEIMRSVDFGCFNVCMAVVSWHLVQCASGSLFFNWLKNLWTKCELCVCWSGHSDDGHFKRTLAGHAQLPHYVILVFLLVLSLKTTKQCCFRSLYTVPQKSHSKTCPVSVVSALFIECSACSCQHLYQLKNTFTNVSMDSMIFFCCQLLFVSQCGPGHF